MHVLGLTGGIGSGKSSAARAFSDQGFSVLDADQVAREVIEPDTEGNTQLRERLGDKAFDPQGRLDRAMVRELAFEHPDTLEHLEAVIHPLVEASLKDAIATHGKHNQKGLVLEVPLLLESGMHSLVDHIVVVDLPEELQLQRAMMRDGATESAIRRIMQAQLARTERLRHADFVLDNSNGPVELRAQVHHLIQHLRGPH